MIKEFFARFQKKPESMPTFPELSEKLRPTSLDGLVKLNQRLGNQIDALREERLSLKDDIAECIRRRDSKLEA